jgi:hypothetical protein
VARLRTKLPEPPLWQTMTMLQASQVGTIALLGISLLSTPLLRLWWSMSGALSLTCPTAPDRSPTSESPSNEARREGWQHWKQALRAVNREREALEAWDPEAARAVNQEAWRRELMALDRGLHLQRAWRCARRAEAASRSRQETYQAVLLLTRVACDSGRHDEELQQARRLAALAPEDRIALMYLQRAAECNGIRSLQEQVARRLEALRQASRALRSSSSVIAQLPRD